MSHLHVPHLADRFMASFGDGVLAAVLHREHWHEPPARTVPAATDWPDWTWEREGYR
jgi:hypothetical protein